MILNWIPKAPLIVPDQDKEGWSLRPVASVFITLYRRVEFRNLEGAIHPYNLVRITPTGFVDSLSFVEAKLWVNLIHET